MEYFASLADLKKIESEMLWKDRPMPRSIYELMTQAKTDHADRPAISYQLFSTPGDAIDTLTWSGLHARVTQAANMFRDLGIGKDDVVACVLPNSMETAIALLGGAVAGVASPINPLLSSEQIAAILRETQAKVVVTLKAFPKTDVPQKVAAALKDAPSVKTVLEVDLVRYLRGAKRFIVPLIRPKNPVGHKADVLSFAEQLSKYSGTDLAFQDALEDRCAALFHTGGTTGMPKVAQHRVSGMVYNGWLGARLLFQSDDCVMCPLPLFHVFAVYPILMSMISSGAHVVFPTPAGYRGGGVFDNLWKLIERYRCTYLVTVPTALAALMQRPVDADISSLRNAFSGSAPLPVELYNRFKRETGVEIVEGYGLTEATCLVSCNPPGGTKKVGSVGLPFPHTDLRILKKVDGEYVDCKVDEIGEICISSPGIVTGATYTEADKNYDLYVEGRYLLTGDLGRLDLDGYLYITGRAKDLIIRSGHNVDPAAIEEVLMTHEAVAFVGAIGQPDSYAGELPCAYVELVSGATVGTEELLTYAADHIKEYAAHPKYIEILTELPKTAVGKVFKPDLRRMAITRVYGRCLAEAGLSCVVERVEEDKKYGLLAHISAASANERNVVSEVLSPFIVPWKYIEDDKD